MLATLRLILPVALAALFAARTLAGEAEDQYAVAAGHYSQSRWQMAADEFQSFVKAYPEHARAPQARFFGGEALIQLGRVADAQAQFELLLERHPQSGFARQARFRTAEAAYVSGQHQTARRLLEAFHDKYPNDNLNEYLLPYLAELLLEDHDASGAQKLFAQAAEVHPAGALAGECRLGLAKANEALGQLDEARRAYREMAAGEGPLAGEAQFELGLLENAAGQYDAAIEALQPFSEDLAQHPLAGKAALQRGWALYKLKRYAPAEACFANLLERDVEALEARYWLGMVLAGDLRWAEAVEPLTKVGATSANPTRVAQCRAALAICYFHTDRLDEARKAYAAFDGSQPSADLWNSTTYQLAEAAFHRDAAWAADLFRALTKDGNAADYVAKGLLGLAWCQLESADEAGSAATFERLIKEHPDDPRAAEAALVRGQALEKLGLDDPALAMYELVIEKYPASRHSGEAIWKAARLNQRLARHQRAVELFERLSAERPPVPQYDALLLHWSEALEELNKPADSTELLERLRRDWPRSPWAADAAYRLAQRQLALKNYDQAATLAREIIEADPPAKNLPHALYLAGQVALAREAWADARAPLERLVRDFPDSPLVFAARYWVAEATYRQKDFAPAAAAFAELTRDASGRTENWLAMLPLRQAQSLAQLGQWADSLAIAGAIHDRYPDFEEQYEADYIIGRALASQAEFAAARDAYARVLRSPGGGKSETAAMAQWMIGETFFHQENYEAAIAAYLRVEILFAYPRWQAGGLLQAGKCQEKLSLWKDASETYSRLIKTFPDSEFNDEAKRRLSLAQEHGTTRKS